jgi:ubiquinone/menaquinone biosynthesis C-methylase UbiE
VPVAARLQPKGILDILDLRKSYLDHAMERARHHGLSNIIGTCGDGGSLPYQDATFDGAYLISVLGEIPDP